MGESCRSRHSSNNRNVHASTRRIESDDVVELHINLCPGRFATAADEVDSLYRAAADILREHRAQIFSERIFASSAAVSIIEPIRHERLGHLDDGAPATALNVPTDDGAAIAGVQLHAIQSEREPELVRVGQKILGRRFDHGGRSWVHLAGLTAPDADAPALQARAVYEQAGDVLRSLGMSFRHVARTWVWLRNILAWYDDFNAVRTAAFENEHLVDVGGRARYLPASTGVGVAPADGGACALEVLAISDGDRSIRSIQAGGEQDSAFSYGSAFARAVVAPMPAGPALFVSGTAAIDPRGVSEYAGDSARQIEATFHHVRALLREANRTEDQIVSAAAYSKTADVARAFADGWSGLPWPRTEIIADICRDELLFEVEAIAAGNHSGK